MKKIIALFVICGFMCAISVADAKIGKRVDSFNESVVLFSYLAIDKIDSFQFDKYFFENNHVKYTLLLSTETINEKQKYSKNDSHIKIDGDIYNIKILETTYRENIYAPNVVHSRAELTETLIEKIKTAKKISLRFYHENGSANTIEVPDHVLAEWKQVIEMDK